MAVPLTEFLSAPGSYEGIDIVRMGVEWCQENISPRYPNFRFQLADIRNAAYNPAGKYQASTYTFPYEDKSFDFVFLTSVFTHMFRPDVEHYVAEMARVLKKGGTCFLTFFILNNDSRRLISQRKINLDFKCELDGCFTAYPENPERAIAFDEVYIRWLLQKFRLTIQEPIHYGSWCRRRQFLSYQDIVIAKRI